MAGMVFAANFTQATPMFTFNPGTGNPNIETMEKETFKSEIRNQAKDEVRRTIMPIDLKYSTPEHEGKADAFMQGAQFVLDKLIATRHTRCIDNAEQYRHEKENTAQTTLGLVQENDIEDVLFSRQVMVGETYIMALFPVPGSIHSPANNLPGPEPKQG